MILKNERENVVDFLRKMSNSGLSGGTTGNISIRNTESNLIAISPSGRDYSGMKAEDIIVLDLKGEVTEGQFPPSSEYLFHLELYKKRNDINAIVHTHSVNAAAYSCLGKDLPPVHYMIGFSGNKVPIVPYSVFGGDELAKSLVKNISNYNAALLENHGVVAVGSNIKLAYACAESIEFVSEVYLKSSQMGEPKILNEEEMSIVIKKFNNYTKLEE